MSELRKNLTEVDVIVNKAPNKMEKIAHQTAAFIKSILRNLGYKGTWTIILSSQIKKKAFVRFTLVRRQGTSILLRIKTGDNGTCWEVFLSPPQGYPIGLVYDDLRQVLPNGTIIKRELNLEKVSVPLIKMPPSPSIFSNSLPPNSPSITDLPPNSPSVIAKPDDSVIVSTEPNSVQINNSVILSETPKEKVMGLFPIPAKDELILESQEILNKGLLAICMGMVDSSIRRREAIMLIIEQMNLKSFVETSAIYNDLNRTAGIIIRGLVQKGLIGRWNCPQRKQNPVRNTTKGYLLTPSGKRKLIALKATLSEDIKQQLPDVENLITIDPATSMVSTVSTPVVSMPPTNVENEGIETILEKFNRYKKSIEDINVIITEIDKRQNDAAIELPMLQDKVLELKAQLEVTNNKIAKINLESSQIENEKHDYEILKQEEQKHFNLIKTELKKLLD